MKKKIFIILAVALVFLLAIGYLFFTYGWAKKVNLEFGGEVKLDLVADGLISPVDMQFPKDNSGRLFIVDRIGKIKILNNKSLIDEPFLDITDKVIPLNSLYDERGFLGLTFHPNFKNNGKFYVYYNAKLREGAPSDWDSTIRLSEFVVSKDNPNKADATSEKIIMEIDKPGMNHNGGQILFGKDNYLYISIGDGGNANDVGKGHNQTIGNGQDTFSILGKILRIDVNGKTSNANYLIPQDNPFSDGKNGLKEIYAYGFRNPWRMSFDSETGKLFVGEVGQSSWEEINIVEKGKNYGWNIKEGTHCFATRNPECENLGYKGEPLIDPIIEYPNAQQKNGMGHTNVGGFMYRGNGIPTLKGKFIFADWSTSFTKADGSLFVAESSETGLWEMKLIAISGRENKRLNEFILSLAQDSENELYLLTTEKTGTNGETGKVYKLT